VGDVGETSDVRRILTAIFFIIAVLIPSSACADSIPEYQFPTLIDHPISDALAATLPSIPTDMPKPYKDRCHVQQNLTATTSSCLYGNLNSKRTIVLFGDSHALSWFPAIEKLAIAKKWRLLSLTMSSCWPATIPAWNPTTNILMNNCAIWRKNALKQIAQVKPYLTFITGTRGFATIDSSGNILIGDARTAAWRSGITTTVKAIKAASQNTVMISDTPVSLYTFPDCLSYSPGSIEFCATASATAIDTDWLTTERDTAANLGVLWVNPTEWICNTDPCSPISGDSAIYRDGGHLTASFAVQLEKPLWAAVSAALTQ
jgi:hypothetical protein